MKKVSALFVFILIYAISFSSLGFASPSVVTYNDFNKKAKSISGKVLTLVKEGAADQVDKLPEVAQLKEELNRNPELAQQYFSSLEAVKALKSGNLHITVDAGQSKIVEFGDGSFVSVSSTITTIEQPASKVTTEGSIQPMDVPGTIYKGLDDYKYEIYGGYKTAELHLNTYFDYGNYYVKIYDTTVSASVNFPAWLVSKDSKIINDTQSRATFEMKDVAGSFTANLYTTINSGPFSYTASHSSN